MLKTIMYQLNNVKKLKKAFISQKKYLKPGQYEFENGIKHVMYNDSNESLEFLKKFKKKPKNLLSFILYKYRKVFFGVIEVSSDEANGFNADFLMFINDNDLKFFNFNQKILLTVISSENKYKKIKRTYQKFSKYVNTPYIKADDEHQIIVEKIINYKPFEDWTTEDEKCFVKTLFQYINNVIQAELLIMKKEITTKDIYNQFQKSIKDKKIIDMVNGKLPVDYQKDTWPLLESHGDIRFDNVLLEEDQFYFIDWEYAEEVIFFHDIIHFIFRKATLNIDKYIKNFFKGDFDDDLSKVFNLVNLEYKEDKKEYYIILYIMNNIQRDAKMNNKNIDELALFYLEVLETYKDS